MDVTPFQLPAPGQHVLSILNQQRRYMASIAFQVTFRGDVFALRVYVGDHQVSMIQASSTWIGTLTLDVHGDSILLEFAFAAPTGTDWAVSLDAAGRNLLTGHDTSKQAQVSYSKTVSLE